MTTTLLIGECITKIMIGRNCRDESWSGSLEERPYDAYYVSTSEVVFVGDFMSCCFAPIASLLPFCKRDHISFVQ